MISPGNHNHIPENVLDELARDAHCAYLSDLKGILAPGCPAAPEELSAAIRSAAEGVHTAGEWELAAQYLMGETRQFTTAEDAVAALLSGCPEENTASPPRGKNHNIDQREMRQET